jgi:Tol biopolymer transport system component
VDTTNCGIPCADLYVVRADGTGVRRLPESDNKQNYAPIWSPSGQMIAFVSQDSFGVFIAQLRTGRVRPLVPDWLSPSDLAWSPDSRALCIDASDDVSNDLTLHLYRVQASGRGRVRLTGSQSTDCNWSPDGSMIAFSDGNNIQAIKPNGTGLTQLTRTAAIERAPIWSPDGTTIAFLRQERGGRNAPYDLWTMAADGSEQTRLTTKVSSAAWSPDGTMLAFLRATAPPNVETGRGGGLWVIGADGTQPNQIAGDALQFSWQPRPG